MLLIFDWKSCDLAHCVALASGSKGGVEKRPKRPIERPVDANDSDVVLVPV